MDRPKGMRSNGRYSTNRQDGSRKSAGGRTLRCPSRCPSVAAFMYDMPERRDALAIRPPCQDLCGCRTGTVVLTRPLVIPKPHRAAARFARQISCVAARVEPAQQPPASSTIGARHRRIRHHCHHTLTRPRRPQTDVIHRAPPHRHAHDGPCRTPPTVVAGSGSAPTSVDPGPSGQGRSRTALGATRSRHARVAIAGGIPSSG